MCGRARALECDGLPRPTWSSESAAVNKNRTSDRPAHTAYQPRRHALLALRGRPSEGGRGVLAAEGMLHVSRPGTAHSQRTWGKPAVVTAPQGECNCQKHERMAVEEGLVRGHFGWPAGRRGGQFASSLGEKVRCIGAGVAGVRREEKPHHWANAQRACRSVPDHPCLCQIGSLGQGQKPSRKTGFCLGPYGLLHA